MPLMTALISMACSSAYQNHQDACSKFLEASSKQIGLFKPTRESKTTTPCKPKRRHQIPLEPVEPMLLVAALISIKFIETRP